MRTFVQRPREPASIAASSGAHGRARPVSSRPRGIAAAGHGGRHVATRHLPWCATAQAPGGQRAITVRDGRSVSRPPTTRAPAGMALDARRVAPRPPTTTTAGGPWRTVWSSVRRPAVHAPLVALAPSGGGCSVSTAAVPWTGRLAHVVWSPDLAAACSDAGGGAWRARGGAPLTMAVACSCRWRLAHSVEGTRGPRDGWRPRWRVARAVCSARQSA